MKNHLRIGLIGILLVSMLLASGCSSAVTQTTVTQTAAIQSGTDQASSGAAASTPGGPGSGNPPQGTPPAGGPGGGNPPGGSTGSSSYTLSGAYTVDGQTATQVGQTYTAAEEDQSAVYVANGGNLMLKNANISTSGNTSSQDNSSFYGLNAAVLAASGSSIDVLDSTITTSGTGANGAFATGSGSTVTLSNVTIDATADGAHGIMATNGGTVNMTNVDINTAGGSSSAIATDRGSGTITVVGGNVVTSGQNSAGIYSTGMIDVSGASFESKGAEAAVIEGGNSITLTDVNLKSTFEKWSVMIYQSMSGDAEGTKGTLTMTNGTLTYTPANGPLFYVTNSMGVITLKNVKITTGSDTLISAAAGNWGSSGSNGGTVIFTVDQQALKGNLVADAISSISLNLQNGSTLEGAINAEHTAQSVSLTLDAASKWTVTSDSYLTQLSDSAGISGTTITNIIGNGHTVYYDSSANPSLGSKTYSLSGGGTLTPAS